jgi:hypothetical protein
VVGWKKDIPLNNDTVQALLNRYYLFLKGVLYEKPNMAQAF